MKKHLKIWLSGRLDSLKGCILMTVCVFYLTRHDYDYPSLVQGESHGILLLYYKYSHPYSHPRIFLHGYSHLHSHPRISIL